MSLEFEIPKLGSVEDFVVDVDSVGSGVVIIVSVGFVPVVVDVVDIIVIVEFVEGSTVAPSDVRIIEIDDYHI